MVQVRRFLDWLILDETVVLKKERDLLLVKVQDYAQKLAVADQEVVRLTIENQRFKAIVDGNRRPETPRIVIASTSAEVRRLMELEASKETEDS
jgi:hypothetical protein